MTKAEQALALLKRYCKRISFSHAFECHDRRGGDCTCGAEHAERELAELLRERPRSAAAKRRTGR